MRFLVPYLFPPARLLEAAAQDLHLPALETLLARGSLLPAPAEGVEAALCEALGIARQQDWPIAPITLERDGGVAGDSYWLRADPVHLRLMRDHIVLTDSDALNLSQQEADALAETIVQHFGEALQPLPLHPTRWYLQRLLPPQLTTTPCSVAVGRDIDSLQPLGPDAMPYRSVLNEVQMLLHEHPVNQAREARGELAVNSLWLWGGGCKPASAMSHLQVYTRDDEARALACDCGASVHPVPAQLEPSLLTTSSLILLDDLTQAGQYGDAYGWREAIRNIETNWFAPLLNLLRTAGATEIQLIDPMSGKALRLRRTDIWKVWRRPCRLIATQNA
jgi:hypothetical protein